MLSLTPSAARAGMAARTARTTSTSALRSIGFGGVTVFELIDLEPPLPRLHGDLATFGKLGWSVEQSGAVPWHPSST
ncbi:hypothetical protein [Nonomuraea rubra]|uniref:Uncharacterized protein n=1 Tax=Nonomuraea rubra TaxID=46180 RepID=A0A7X0TXA2_9ACTN|nr:hypothetical protein [Nonomuraea rubra]MBB6547246.1 hypothetical protein [Nonomuraea rubra]